MVITKRYSQFYMVSTISKMYF